MAAEQLTPTEYINHHLTFMAKPFGDGGFWTLHVDSLVVSILLGIVGIGLFWLVARGATAGVPGKRQAFVELCFDFIDEQVKGIFHGDRHKFVAPAALTVFVWVLLMNAMDFLPVDIIAMGTHHISEHGFRIVPTADVNTTFALALSVWLLMIYYSDQGERARRLDPRTVLLAVRLQSAAVAVQFPVQPRRVHLQAAVALAAAVRQHVRGRNHLPAAVAVGRDRAWSARSSAPCSAWAGRSSTS